MIAIKVCIRARPGFCGMKRLGIFLLPPRLDATPLLLPQQPFIHLGEDRHCASSVLAKNTTQFPQPGLEPGPLNPGTNAPTIRPPCLYIMITITRVKLREGQKLNLLLSDSHQTKNPALLL